MIKKKTTLPEEVKPSLIIYGKPKSGKSSTLATFKKAIICDLENGYEEHIGFIGDRVKNWEAFVSFVSELKSSPEWRSEYNWIVLDTMSKLYEYAREYIKDEQSVTHLDSLLFGKGHTYPTDLVIEQLNTIKSLGYGIIYVLHSNEKEKRGKDNETIPYVYPVLDTRPFAYVSADVTATIYFRNVDGKSNFCLGKNPSFMTGSRLMKYLPPVIDANEESLIKSFSDARKVKAEEYMKINGGTISLEQTKDEEYIDENTKFVRLVEELKQAYRKAENKNIIAQLQNKIFGEDFTKESLTPLMNTKIVSFLNEIKKYTNKA